MKIDPDACALEGYRVACRGPATHEHIVRRGLASKNKAAQEYLDDDMNITLTCVQHNVGKLSDSYDARKLMLLQKIWRHGFTNVADYYAGVPWSVRQHEYTLEAMLE